MDSKAITGKASESSESYLVLDISNSPTKYKYKQTFAKIDTVDAYLGGLVSSILGIFFIAGMFSGKAYLISAAQRIFRRNKY